MYKKHIERLSEINCAESLISIGDDLREERSGIVRFLVIENVIKLDVNGGFHFIGENAEDNKIEYLSSFDNF